MAESEPSGSETEQIERQLPAGWKVFSVRFGDDENSHLEFTRQFEAVKHPDEVLEDLADTVHAESGTEFAVGLHGAASRESKPNWTIELQLDEPFDDRHRASIEAVEQYLNG